MTTPDGRGDSAEVATLLQMLRRTAGEVQCLVEGGSMGAAIPDGASVRIMLDGAKDAPLGSAVALLLGGDRFSIHRLMARGRSRRARGFVVTHGDGNVFCDAPQRDSALLGTVVAVCRSGESAWQPVPDPMRHGLLRRSVTATFERIVCLALELSPHLGMAIKGALVLAVTPFVWLRPYPPGRVPSASVAHRSRP